MSRAPTPSELARNGMDDAHDATSWCYNLATGEKWVRSAATDVINYVDRQGRHWHKAPDPRPEKAPRLSTTVEDFRYRLHQWIGQLSREGQSMEEVLSVLRAEASELEERKTA